MISTPVAIAHGQGRHWESKNSATLLRLDVRDITTLDHGITVNFARALDETAKQYGVSPHAIFNEIRARIVKKNPEFALRWGAVQEALEMLKSIPATETTPGLRIRTAFRKYMYAGSLPKDEFLKLLEFMKPEEIAKMRGYPAVVVVQREKEVRRMVRRKPKNEDTLHEVIR